MPKGEKYPKDRMSDLVPGEPGPTGNAADARKARAPRGSAAEKIEASMMPGEGPAKMAAPYDGNTVWRTDWSKVGKPQSPSANSQSRNRRIYKRIFEKDE